MNISTVHENICGTVLSPVVGDAVRITNSDGNWIEVRTTPDGLFLINGNQNIGLAKIAQRNDTFAVKL